MRSTTSERAPRTPAQWYCLLVGGVLLLVGIFGFFADANFDTTKADNSNASGLQGDSFLGFEVNGWHNVVHLLSGLVLLAAANTRPTAKTTAIGFGFVYGLVALIGLIDGEDVLGIIPVNGADNVLHVVLSIAGIAAGLASATTKRAQLRNRRNGRTVEERLPDSPSSETRRPAGSPTGGDGAPTGIPAAPAGNLGDTADGAELPAGPGRAETRGDTSQSRFSRKDELVDDPTQVRPPR